jgi:hypothetical protein
MRRSETKTAIMLRVYSAVGRNINAVNKNRIFDRDNFVSPIQFGLNVVLTLREPRIASLTCLLSSDLIVAQTVGNPVGDLSRDLHSLHDVSQ